MQTKIMNKLQELKEYIQKEIPEILNLDLGGIVEANFFGKREKFVCLNGFRMTELSFPKGIYQTDKFQLDGVPIETLGRPITLEDVLRVSEKNNKKTECCHKNSHNCIINGLKSLEFWTLGKPLDQQSEKTIEFLHNLLIRDK